MRNPAEAVVGATAVYTDVWTSMGQEAQQEARTNVFSGVYQVNDALLEKAKPGCLVLHCLPARRGLEITVPSLKPMQMRFFEEAENRLHAQKAVLTLLMG